MRRRILATAVAAAAFAAVAAGCGGAAAKPVSAASSSGSFSDEIAQVKSGVIRIEAQTCSGKAVGTGILLRPNLVATVEHVVDGALQITLKRDGKTLTSAHVVGADRDRDLALLQTKTPISGYAFGFSASAPKLGEDVGALGFPLGLPLTVTRGSVSGFDRVIPIDGVKRRHLVQTDAAVNPGNSGGPLLSIESGKVVGLVDLGTNAANGIAFAVSADVAAPLLKAWAAAPQPLAQTVCGSGNGQPPASASAGGITPASYADAVDTALVDSARTRGDLGDLINGVNSGSYDYTSAVGAINSIVDQRRNLLANVQAVTAPGPFGRSAELLKASLVASIADDLAVEEWVKAKLNGDNASANAAWQRNIQLSQRASAAKSQFLKTYNGVRSRLLGRSPLDVAY